MAKTCLRRGVKIFAARPQTGKSQKSRLFYFGNFPGTSRAITLMNLVPANQFGSHFLNHKNRNWKHMHQTKWHKLQNILCQKYDKNSRLFSFQRNMIKSWKPMAPHCWAVFMSQVWQSPKMDSWNFSRSVHITRIWIFTMLEECLRYKMNLCQKQDHRWWRYHRRLLDYQSPYFQLIIE